MPRPARQMLYELVLQWPFTGMDDYKHMIAYEDILISRLSRRLARVGGHDTGSGTMNIFVLTDRPAKAFAECRALIRSRRIEAGLSAAYFAINSEDRSYVRLWPLESVEPFLVM